MQQSSFEREIHSYTGLSHETRKIPSKLTLYLRELEKEEQTKPNVNKGRKDQSRNK